MRRIAIMAALLAGCGGAQEPTTTEAELVVHVPCVREPCAAGDEAPAEAEPPPLGGRPPIRMLALGQEHSCALTEDGAVYCWGDNSRGQLGDIGERRSPIPAEVPSLPPMAAIWAGWNATCGRTADAEAQLWCWGETGLGASQEPGFATALPFENVRVVALFDRRGCFVTGDGDLYCWGRYGVPHGPNWDSPRRVPVEGATSIDLSFLRGCAVGRDRAPRCWGQRPPYLQTERLGDDLWTYPDLRNVTIVRLGESPQGDPLVVDRDGQVFATERGARVRNGSTHRVATRALAGLEGAVVEVVDGASHFCARRSDGTAACWGYNGDGQLGDGTEAERRPEPRILPLADVEEIAAGSHHTCARAAGGRLFCWGRNTDGQLGIDGIREANQPMEVPW